MLITFEVDLGPQVGEERKCNRCNMMQLGISFTRPLEDCCKALSCFEGAIKMCRTLSGLLKTTLRGNPAQLYGVNCKVFD